MPKPLNLIVACSENRIIGRDGKLPFDIPEDKAWLEEKTANHLVVLGRIGFQSWPKVRAEGRQPVVVTHDRSLAPKACGLQPVSPKRSPLPKRCREKS